MPEHGKKQNKKTGARRRRALRPCFLPGCATGMCTLPPEPFREQCLGGTDCRREKTEMQDIVYYTSFLRRKSVNNGKNSVYMTEIKINLSFWLT